LGSILPLLFLELFDDPSFRVLTIRIDLPLQPPNIKFGPGGFSHG